MWVFVEAKRKVAFLKTNVFTKKTPKIEGQKKLKVAMETLYESELPVS